MTATIARVAYHSTVREMPSDERPRERLEHYGAASLQTAELLAIILRVGTAQENVIELSSRLLRQYGGLGGLLAVDFAELCREHGLGQAKAAQLKAALEIGRRLSVLAPTERPQITQPADVANLVMFPTPVKSSQFACFSTIPTCTAWAGGRVSCRRLVGTVERTLALGQVAA